MVINTKADDIHLEAKEKDDSAFNHAPHSSAVQASKHAQDCLPTKL